MSSSIDPGQVAPTELGATPPTEAPPALPSSESTSPEQVQSSSQTDELPRLETFAAMELGAPLLRAIEQMGWSQPTVVQASTFAPIRLGRDVLVQSQTGTGKTGAFCLPWLATRFDAANPAQTGVQLLVLVPTRELAKQVCDELGRLGQHMELALLPVYGGTAMEPQLNALRAGVHAVVGTPGRILDHIRRRSLDLSRVRMVVLDEADEMLSMGFLEDIHAILDACTSTTRQTALFSATVPPQIERIARRYMNRPVPVKLSGDDIAAAEIHHCFYSVSSAVKTRDLIDVIAVEEPASGLVFCNTREEVNLVASVLQREGFAAEPLSSDLTQAARERVLGWMREGKLRFLVATDVASRGIDISHISHVINYSFPENAETYVHRTGRTGRAGRAGQAISLISPLELGNFYYLKLQYPSIVFAERHLPAGDELQVQRTELKLDQISKVFPDLVSPEWTLLARNLMKDPRGERVIALLLSRAMAELPRPTSALRQEFAESGPRRDARPEREERAGRRTRNGRGRDSKLRSRDAELEQGSSVPQRGSQLAEDQAPVPTEAAIEVQQGDREGDSTDSRRRRGRRSRRPGAAVPTYAETPREDLADGVIAPLPIETIAPVEIEALDGGEAPGADMLVPSDLALALAPGGESDLSGVDAGISVTGQRRRRRRRGNRRGGVAGTETGAGDLRGSLPEGDDEDGAQVEIDDGEPLAVTTADRTGQAGDGRRRRRRRRSRRSDGSAVELSSSSEAGKVTPERPVPQDEIVVDIDESELQLVREEFGEIDELDDFTLKGRRRGVLDGLAEEVDLEDLSTDAAPSPGATPVREEGRGEGEAEIDGETDVDDDGGEELAAAEEDETGEPKRRRRRRRRKKKPEPEPPPALMAPPHKDFWEVWSAHFSFRDFEDSDPPEPELPEQVPAAADSSPTMDGTWLRVSLNLGRAHGHKASDIRDLLVQRTGLAGRTVRNVTVGDGDTEFQVASGAWARLQETVRGPWEGIELAVALLPDPEAPEAAPIAGGGASAHPAVDAIAAAPPSAEDQGAPADVDPSEPVREEPGKSAPLS